MKQTIIHGIGTYKQIESLLLERNVVRFLLVCDKSFPLLGLQDYFDALRLDFSTFDAFTPNPTYEQVCAGVERFNTDGCEAIVAIGGGSTIDVAKGIRLFCKMDSTKNFLDQAYIDNNVFMLALPTTAGTGSESTHFAVIYDQGIKQSLAHKSLTPSCAILDPGLLLTLPVYQKKCTLLDALCQAIESWWSIRSTQKSIAFSKLAIKKILAHLHDYLDSNNPLIFGEMLLAANYAGRAINITQTTAAHAMSYKLSSLYQLPHGHSVALCLPEVWHYMLDNMNRCVDARGSTYLNATLDNIANALGQPSQAHAISFFSEMLEHMQINRPDMGKKTNIDALVRSVNLQRLNNTPVSIDEKALFSMYRSILMLQ